MAGERNRIVATTGVCALSPWRTVPGSIVKVAGVPVETAGACDSVPQKRRHAKIRNVGPKRPVVLAMTATPRGGA